MNHLLNISPRNYDDIVMTPGQILGWFEISNAVWLHDGDPIKPHAELTTGLCTNGYFDCQRVLMYPNLCEILARQLARQLTEELRAKGIERVDWVIGSAYAAITFSYEVAKALKAIHGFVEKDLADPKRMVWQRITIPTGAKVLQVEELITTGQTVREVERAVKTGNREPVYVLSIIGALVHRPLKFPVNPADYGDRKVTALIEEEVWAVDPKDCPLCKAGSPRLRPKTHWKELTGKA